MQWLNAMISSGRIFDLIAGLMLTEVVALWGWRRATGRGLRMSDVVVSIGAGLCLVLAFRSLSVGWPYVVTAIFLIGALAAHLLDLFSRLRSGAIQPELKPETGWMP